MKPTLRPRWLLLGAMLLATLTAAAWVREAEREPATQAVVAPARALKVAQDARRAEPPETVRLDKLGVPREKPGTGDPFAVKSWRKPAPPPPKVVKADPPPPPPPSAPPLPYSYMGKLIDESGTAVFLTAGDRNLVARQGETLDSTYRVNSINEAGVVLTHLPTGIQQTLSIGDPQ